MQSRHFFFERAHANHPAAPRCSTLISHVRHERPTMRAADRGLFRDSYEKDSCGFGLIAQLDDQPSHWLVRTAMTSLNRLTHRGAVASDGKTGDGCGLLLKQPEEFLRALAREAAIDLAHMFASGLVFLNPDPARAEAARRTLLVQLEAEGLKVAGWRQGPTNPDACGAGALESLPRIELIFVNCVRSDLDEAA